MIELARVELRGRTGRALAYEAVPSTAHHRAGRAGRAVSGSKVDGMSDAEVNREDRHGKVRSLADHLGVYHRRGLEARVDAELAQDTERVGFDLGVDLAHPSLPQGVAGFDLDTDIGRDNEPPELRL
jgi:hypothetical protein